MAVVGRCGFAFVFVIATAAVGRADAPTATLDRWPTVPEYHGLSLEDVITDHLSEIGNLIGSNIDVLSHDMIGLHVDGRKQRAQLRVGGGNVRYLAFRID